MKRHIRKLKPKVKAALPRLSFKKDAEEISTEGIPRITNETIAAHREEVLSGARKYIYPLQHSKHRIVVISTTLLISAVIIFFAYCWVALYKLQSTSTFVYGITEVIPFPVAKIGSHYIPYESYLFELRRYVHYYETQQRVDFHSSAGQQQLVQLKRRAMNQVLTNAYVSEIAKRHNVTVSDRELNTEIALVRSQNRLGGGDQVFRTVLQEFWGWSEADFKRELRQQLLEQKLIDTLDTGTHQRAEQALQQLQGGADFAVLAKQVSDDQATKENGGAFGVPISRSSRDIAPQISEALFSLEPGQHSAIINTGYSLEIVKLLEKTGDKVRGAHIVFNFKDPSAFINPERIKLKPHQYISV